MERGRLEAFDARTRQLEEQTIELKRLNEQKNEFLGIAAHDLRNPLGLISGWTSVMIRQIEGGRFVAERGVRNLSKVFKVAQRMNRMVSELLDIAAIEAGKAVVFDREEMVSLADEYGIAIVALKHKTQ